jgi:hypothetical protein
MRTAVRDSADEPRICLGSLGKRDRPSIASIQASAGTTIAPQISVDLRRTSSPVIVQSQPEPRTRAESNGAFTSPLPSMLELSAATRAVAAEPALRSAVATLQREACRLTRSCDATVVTLDWDKRTTWTLDGSLISGEVRALIARVAGGGQRELSGYSLIEPIGGAPARAVLALRRGSGDPFQDNDVALVAALAGSVAATINRLLDLGA